MIKCKLQQKKRNAYMEDKLTGKAKGGLARAKALSTDQLKEIATKASAARWSDEVEIAKSFGEIQVADTMIPCAVLEDGTRVLSERAITKAFGGKRGGSHWKRLKAMEQGDYLPVFLSAGNIKPFISADLETGLARRRIYRPKRGGTPAYGIEAALLPKICNVYLSMRDKPGSLTASQLPLAMQADLLMRGLAEVGITALVDEATGYIHEKKKDEYREIFKEFIRKECREWEQEFPMQFFDMLYRLYELPKGINGRHPQFFGKFITKYIYTPLAGSDGAILKHLEENNPVIYKDGVRKGRKHKMHQFLTDELGLPAVRSHIWQVTGIGNGATSKDAFDRSIKRAFPVRGHQENLFDENDF
jgi:P63C domain